MITIFGKVIHGDHFGKKLGFPTANLDRRDYVRRKLKIRFGIYAGYAEIVRGGQNDNRSTSPALRAPSPRLGRRKRWKAGIIIGPLDKKGLPRIEAHLIGFKGNLYGKYLNTYLNTYLRPYKKFKNVEDLKKQIAKDISAIKKMTFSTNSRQAKLI